MTLRSLLCALPCFALFASLAAAAPATPIPVRFVVVTTFDTGDDAGTKPGEFNVWVVNFPLPTVLPFPQGYHHLRYNAEKQVLAIETGEGPVRMAASIEALANDPRFDLKHSYWMLAGIAGEDPNVGPAASAAWAEYVVDGDLAYEIDAREIPPQWSTGYVPLGRTSPFERPAPAPSSVNGVNLYHLNPGFVKWAYAFSHAHVSLPDTANLRTLRSLYTSFPATQSPPEIVKGDTLAAGTFWIGSQLNAWAEKWVTYWSHGKATLAMSAEEDAGYMQAITFLAQGGMVDQSRVLDLRASSDFTVPPPGQPPAQLLANDSKGTGPSAFAESFNDVYLTASSVVNEIAGHWSEYADHVPTAP